MSIRIFVVTHKSLLENAVFLIGLKRIFATKFLLELVLLLKSILKYLILYRLLLFIFKKWGITLN